jgi:hypothetical protein
MLNAPLVNFRQPCSEEMPMVSCAPPKTVMGQSRCRSFVAGVSASSKSARTVVKSAAISSSRANTASGVAPSLRNIDRRCPRRRARGGADDWHDGLEPRARRQTNGSRGCGWDLAHFAPHDRRCMPRRCGRKKQMGVAATVGWLQKAYLIRAPAGLDLHIAALCPAQLLQDLLERSDARTTFCIFRGRIHEHTDTSDARGRRAATLPHRRGSR